MLVLFALLAITAALMAGWRWMPRDNLTFVSLREGAGEIYALDRERGILYNLTRSPGHDSDPAWSSDGTRLAFVSWRDGNRHLYLMDMPNHRTWRVSEQRIPLGYHAVWSPDGARLAFEVEESGTQNVYVADATTGVRMQITDDRAADRYPVWSPDGARLAFVSWRTGDAEIFVTDASCFVRGNCENPVNVSQHRATDTNPAWSPDGRQLVFMSDRSNYREIYLVDIVCAAGDEACGAGARPLTEDRSEFNDLVWGVPLWSPDSRRIAYLSVDRKQVVNIQTIATRPRNEACCALPRRITQIESMNVTLAGWSPDSSLLAFSTAPSWNGNWDVFVLDAADGGNLRRLTTHEDYDVSPIWWTPGGSDG